MADKLAHDEQLARERRQRLNSLLGGLAGAVGFVAAVAAVAYLLLTGTIGFRLPAIGLRPATTATDSLR